MKNDRRIIGLKSFSPGKKAGLKVGDTLLSINGQKVTDIFDYRFLCSDTQLEIEVLGEDGNVRKVNVHKEEAQDLGITFENPMLACDKSCANNCVFCFINQMPKGMRDTLYFKDDDMRLSFLTGSYVTLTNCTWDELKRIAKYHMSPINVSVHTLNPELRVKMLNHKGAGDVEEKIRFLLESGITVNGQIVLCPGYNDKDELKFTLDKMLDFPENFESCSIVPVGITKYREGLPELRTFTQEEAEETLNLIEDYRQMAYIKRKSFLFHASDEFYLKAEREIPSEEAYDGYPQLENGVGMIRLLREETDAFLADFENNKKLLKKIKRLKNKTCNISVATGELACGEIDRIAKKVSEFCKKFGFTLNIKVYSVENKFFGPEITVAGLLTGRDLIYRLSGKTLGERLLLTTNMFKAGEDVFLDNVTLKELEKQLAVKGVRTGKSGADIVTAMIFGECYQEETL